MPLSVADLTAIFRTETSDPELPGSGDDSDSLWLDAEIADWLDEAQKELCERVDLLFDRSSFSIKTVEEIDLYALDDDITKVRRGVVTTITTDPQTGAVQKSVRKLEALSIKELSRHYQPNDWDFASVDGIITYDWETLTGTPKYMVTDFEVGCVRLVPTPAKTDAGDSTETIALDVYRLPSSSNMEVANKYRRDLLNKVKFFAYSKDDVDSQNLIKAEKYEDRWEQSIQRIDKQFKRLNRGPQVVSYGGL